MQCVLIEFTFNDLKTLFFVVVLRKNKIQIHISSVKTPRIGEITTPRQSLSSHCNISCVDSFYAEHAK